MASNGVDSQNGVVIVRLTKILEEALYTLPCVKLQGLEKTLLAMAV
jgi:hypothetical protein